MIAEIVGEIIGPTFNFIARLLIHIIFDGLIQGAGYLLCRPFSGRKLDPDSAVVIVVGLAFWIAVGAVLYTAMR